MSIEALAKEIQSPKKKISQDYIIGNLSLGLKWLASYTKSNYHIDPEKESNYLQYIKDYVETLEDNTSKTYLLEAINQGIGQLQNGGGNFSRYNIYTTKSRLCEKKSRAFVNK